MHDRDGDPVATLFPILITQYPIGFGRLTPRLPQRWDIIEDRSSGCSCFAHKPDWQLYAVYQCECLSSPELKQKSFQNIFLETFYIRPLAKADWNPEVLLQEQTRKRRK